MIFKDLLDKLEPEYHRINFRERFMLRKAFDLIRADYEEESILSFDIAFDNEQQRDDWDLTCSCGALFHCEDECSANAFIEDNHYCSVCGRKFRFKKEND